MTELLSHQGSSSDGSKVITIAVVGATAAGRRSLGLVHLWLVWVIIDVILTLRRKCGVMRRQRQTEK